MAAKKKPVQKPVGRKPRETSKTRREALIAEAHVARIEPLTYMLDVLNAPTPVRAAHEDLEEFAARCQAHEDRRMDAAKAAAPYIHPRPTAAVKIESITDVSEQQPVNVLELAKKVAFLFTLAHSRPELDITPRQIN